MSREAARAGWVAYVPRWAGPHVEGGFTPRDEDGVQVVRASCARCGAVFGPAKCISGLVRDKIDKFARTHAHGNPLAARHLDSA